MPEAAEFKALTGRRVRLKQTPAGGGGEVEGLLAGTIDSADGLVVVIQPDSGHRVSLNYQHIAALTALD